jgi:hypothetical protein
MSRRGFVYTLDAMFAVLILLILLATFSFFSADAEENPYPLLVLKKQANDMLIVLDKKGDLATGNITQINESLHENFPPSLQTHMELEYYNFSNRFHYVNATDFGADYSGIDELVLAQREFLVLENGSVKYYAIARLRIWS